MLLSQWFNVNCQLSIILQVLKYQKGIFLVKMTSHLTAVELLKLGDEDRKKPFLNIYWPYIIGTAFGIGTGVFMNFGTRRPLFSGIQKHIVGVAAWTSLLTYVQYKRDEYYAEKDAVYLHYVELHPEDFPTPERKKIGDILEPWVPIR